MKIRRREHTIPSLNLASLPDLIFTVLFFFMIVTHMRNVTPRVKYQMPQGTELMKTANKGAMLYIYIGVDNRGKSDSKTLIQVNDKMVEPEQLVSAIANEKAKLSPAVRHELMASVKADRQTPMTVIMQVKQALREAEVARITYSANQKSAEKPENL